MASHSFVIACECGASLGMSPGVTNITEDMEAASVIRAWEELHSGRGHERVTCFEARRIRDRFNRAKYGYAWGKQHPERVRASQAKYRQKRREQESLTNRRG